MSSQTYGIAFLITAILFLALYIVQINEEYADLLDTNKTGWCNVQFGDSKATIPCERVSRLD